MKQVNYIVWRKVKKLFLPALFLWILLPSCVNEEACEDLETVPVRLGFYYVDEEQDEPKVLSIDSIYIHGLNNDSIIYNYRRDVSRVELPLNAAANTTAFLLYFPAPPEIAHLVKDTIWFTYELKPTLISMECGFASFFELLEVRHSNIMIDSISIEETSITNNLDEHIKIFPFVDDSEL
ncbi:MAG: DUF6452 family protein [Bacteroidales bacterium]